MTRPSIVFRAEAEAELVTAKEWYDLQQAGLGEEFLTDVEVALDRICEFPESAPIVHRDVRRQLVPRFPHSILYLVEVDRVVVLAVFHGRQNPDAWKDRR